MSNSPMPRGGINNSKLLRSRAMHLRAPKFVSGVAEAFY
jgi:hypothetical protein